MDALTITLVCAVGAFLIGAFVMLAKRLSKGKALPIPDSAAVWLGKITPQVLFEAYQTAVAQSSEPSMRRDIAVSYIKSFVFKTFGVELPTAIANFLIEYIVTLVKYDGVEKTAATLGIKNVAPIAA